MFVKKDSTDSNTCHHNFVDEFNWNNLKYKNKNKSTAYCSNIPSYSIVIYCSNIPSFSLPCLYFRVNAGMLWGARPRLMPALILISVYCSHLTFILRNLLIFVIEWIFWFFRKRKGKGRERRVKPTMRVEL